MGIKTSQGGGNVRFFGINMKKGCIVEGSGQSKTEYEAGKVALEGIPYRLAVQEDEFEGQKSLKANLYMKDPDGGPNMCVSWTIYTEAHEASSQGLKVLGCLLAANTRKVVSIKPWFAEAGLKLGNITFDRDGSHVSFKQPGADGKLATVTPDYAGHGAELPQVPTVKVGNKEVKDKGQWNQIMEQLVATLSQRLEAENPRNGQQQQQAAGPGVGADDIDPADLAAAGAERSGMSARG